jgi:hypothetical protein
MKILRKELLITCLLAPAALWLASGPAAAVTLRVFPQSIYQVGTGPSVYVGHTVDAHTSFNRLLAGGSSTINCNNAATLPLTGQRSLTGETWGGPTSLVVTIPTWLPAQQTIPGFSSVPPDTQLSCTYAWTARAVESGYSINLGLISYPIGSGERTEGGTVPFTMYKPDRTDDGCIKN